jgi:hypothetical protein
MFSDYSENTRSLDSTLPLAHVIDRHVVDAAGPWLAANAPTSAVWEMPCHLGFWDDPAEFNDRLAAFLDTA